MDVKRYNHEAGYDAGPYSEMVEHDDGKYVHYDDIKHLLTRPDPDPMSKEEADKLIENVMRLREDGLSYKLSLDYKTLIAALTGKGEPDGR